MGDDGRRVAAPSNFTTSLAVVAALVAVAGSAAALATLAALTVVAVVVTMVVVVTGLLIGGDRHVIMSSVTGLFYHNSQLLISQLINHFL